ncbi:uridine-preferring nucleoside hydrolase UriH [Rathayibacter sp. VKM Ac-2630]|uniref:uridine-preferring nucleoside hydrolase UriH n=1 Tax=Rathayibacter sp. VKM Ac-2630 TaxID=1938617 RepID=UPI00098194B1|nr:nucleoside hydrolase [Rathayibacter sp. VKM Ac-2630]OOB91717.1 ribonucleoside hydrolase [Rathayibacter sp. VKM Ac-2630]
MSGRRIILDCDPGHDDALAILLAHGSPEIELVAITTVAGNQSLEKVTGNARAVAAVAGLVGVPIAAGMHRPLVREAEPAPSIHGESGMDGPSLPAERPALDPRHAVDLIIEEVMSSPAGSITLVPTGPLTNIAMAVRREPRLVERVREVVLMGGGVQGGNWTATAEFNILADPEAAHIVFGAGWAVTMVGLDVTHRALATEDVVARFRGLDSDAGRFCVGLLDFFAESYREAQGFDAPPVHDPVAVAYVIDPSILEVRRAPLTVELRGEHTVGMTVADLRSAPPADCRTSVATGIETERFWDLVLDAAGRL